MSPEKPVRVAVYARQSVAEAEGIAAQVTACREFLKSRPGWVEVDTYEDNATSASKDRGAGTGWARMLADVDAGEVDAVVVVAVDRLMRRLSDVLEVRPPKRDLRVVTVRGGIDTGDPSGMGSFVLGLFVLVAEQEIHTKKARNLPYVARRRAAGHPWPGRVPYGYEWVPALQRDRKETRWRVVPAEAKVVRRIFREFMKPDAKLKAIAAGLNADPTPSPTGGAWHSSTVRRILLSPFVAGLLPPRQPGGDFKPERVVIEECARGAWTALVTEAQYRAARHLLLDDTTRRKNVEGVARKWLLSGIALCGVCRVPVRSAKTREGFHGYRCPAGHFLRRGELLDLYVEEAVIGRLSQPDAATLLRPSEKGPDLVTLNALRASLGEREAYLGRKVATGEMRPEAADQGLALIREEAAALDAQLSAALTSDPLASIVGAADVRAAWSRLGLGARRAILGALAVPVIEPVGKGRRVLDLEDAERSMLMLWRDAMPLPGWMTWANLPGDLSQETAAKVAEAANS